MIAVTGASGQLGRLIIEQLLVTGVPADQIVTVARSIEKIEDLKARGVQVRFGDYTNVSSLKSAFQGVGRVLLVSSSEVGQRYVQHKNVIDAAKSAQVKRIVYTSILAADKSPLLLAGEHRQTEDLLTSSGVDYTILRNGWYSENYLAGVEAALSLGALYGCAQEGRFSTASRKDYAEAAAVVLTQDGHSKKTYELAGDDSFNLKTFAGWISEKHGKQIPFVNLGPSDFEGALKQAGLPEGLATALADSEKHAADGWLENDSGQLSKLIGHPTTAITSQL